MQNQLRLFRSRLFTSTITAYLGAIGAAHACGATSPSYDIVLEIFSLASTDQEHIYQSHHIDPKSTPGLVQLEQLTRQWLPKISSSLPQ